MNRKSLHIFMLVTSVAILALVFVQGYWIYNSFKQEERNLQEIIRIATNRIDQSIWNFFSPDYTINPSPVASPESNKNDSIESLRPLAASNFVGFYKSGEDSIPVYTAKYVHNQISNEQIDSIIQSVIESYDLPGKYFYELQESPQPAGFRLKEIPAKFTKSHASKPIVIPNPRGKNAGQNLYMYFPESTGQILLRMGWLSMVNVILIIVIVVAFVRAFRIIMRQKKLQQMRKDFINNLSHEYRTPVASVSLAIDGLINYSIDKDETKRKNYLEMARKENHRLGLMIERTLNLASFEQGNLQIVTQKLDIHQIIKEVVSNFEIHIAHRKGRITTIFDSDNSLVWGDSDHLLQCFYNLVDNASKFSDGAPMVTIQSVAEEKNRITIRVSDQGIGIPKNMQKKIFKTYRRTQESKEMAKGFGLGLSYVEQIIKMHQGSISLESRVNIGSTFIIKLPLYHE